MNEKLNKVLSIVEITLTAILFVAMLVCCGLYINVKINGKSSSLKPLSEDETALILRTTVADSENMAEDLITPLFVGVKNSDVMIGATFDSESRTSMNQFANDVIAKLFSVGSAKPIEFKSNAEFEEYVDGVKNADAYIFVSYYNDLNAALFAPCLGGSYTKNINEMLFDVKHIFVLPDASGNVCAVTFSSGNAVNVISLDENIPFNQLSLESYNISEGYAYFTFAEGKGIHPVFASSFMSDEYIVTPLPKLCKIGENSAFSSKLFDFFDMTQGLVNSYYTKNDSVMNYVDESGVVTIDSEGYLMFDAESDGISLNNYLGYLPGESGNFSFADKLTAVKMLVGRLHGISEIAGLNNARFLLTDCVYDSENNDLTFFLKLFVDGISVTENSFDASITMNNNCLTKLEMLFAVCKRVDAESLCFPQQYALYSYENDTAIKTDDTLYATLVEKQENDTAGVSSEEGTENDEDAVILRPEWAKKTQSGGGTTYGNR